MSKYLGESEKNLRVHFDEAEKAWMEQGEKSDLHIIIIDEIDAICKPRGSNQYILGFVHIWRKRHRILQILSLFALASTFVIAFALLEQTLNIYHRP